MPQAQENGVKDNAMIDSWHKWTIKHLNSTCKKQNIAILMVSATHKINRVALISAFYVNMLWIMNFSEK